MSETLSAVGAGAAVQARACIGGLVYSLRLAIAGNPNCGKTTVFNALTGAHQHVGNYSGVTVEKKEGYIRYEGQEVILVDLPGAYSLSAYSQEEIVASDVLLDGTVQAVINVVDAGILERGLLLTVQLREMGLPVVIACNMMDEAEAAGICIDFSRLEAMLGVRAVPTVGTTGKGLRASSKAGPWPPRPTPTAPPAGWPSPCCRTTLRPPPPYAPPTPTRPRTWPGWPVRRRKSCSAAAKTPKALSPTGTV